MKELYWIVLKSILSNTFHRRKGQGRHEGVKIRIFTFFISTSAGSRTGMVQNLHFWCGVFCFFNLAISSGFFACQSKTSTVYDLLLNFNNWESKISVWKCSHEGGSQDSNFHSSILVIRLKFFRRLFYTVLRPSRAEYTYSGVNILNPFYSCANHFSLWINRLRFAYNYMIQQFRCFKRQNKHLNVHCTEPFGKRQTLISL